jgi:hypothetical protein
VLTQSASAAQVGLLHAVADAHTTPPGQGLAAGAAPHMPAPSQNGCVRSCPVSHTGDPQVVVLLRFRQPLLPSQVPSRPQAVVSATHLPLDDPPATIGRHRPLAALVSALAHETQVVSQAL